MYFWKTPRVLLLRRIMAKEVPDLWEVVPATKEGVTAEALNSAGAMAEAIPRDSGDSGGDSCGF
jgi:hypothetical protein